MDSKDFRYRAAFHRWKQPFFICFEHTFIQGKGVNKMKTSRFCSMYIPLVHFVQFDLLLFKFTRHSYL